MNATLKSKFSKIRYVKTQKRHPFTVHTYCVIMTGLELDPKYFRFAENKIKQKKYCICSFLYTSACKIELLYFGF